MSSWQDNLKTSLGLGNLYCRLVNDIYGGEVELKYVSGEIFRKDSYSSSSWNQVQIVTRNMTTVRHSDCDLALDEISSSRDIFIKFCYHWRCEYSVYLEGVKL